MIYRVDDSRFAVDLPKIAMALPHSVHVVWSETSAADSWNPSGVFYTRSEDSGNTWDEATRLSSTEGRHGLPNLIIDGAGRIIVIWLRSVGSADGRYYTWSADGGSSWLGPFEMTFGSGFTSAAPGLALDGDGRAHFLNAAEVLGGSILIHHSVWQGSAWSQPESIPDARGEGATLTIRGGNQILAVWHNAGDVYFSEGVLDAGSIPFSNIPLSTGVEREEVLTTLTATNPNPEVPASSLVGESLAPLESPGLTMSPESSAMRVVFLPALLCVFLLVMAAVIRLRRSHL